MREAQFNSEIVNSFRHHGFWAYKIADAPTSRTMHLTRFALDKPCDILVMGKGRGYAIEGKQIKKFKAFGLSQIRGTQEKALNEITKAGNRAFIFLNVRISGRRPKDRVNKLYIFPWSLWYPVWKKRGSIKKKELERMPGITGKRVGSKKRIIFDLSEWLVYMGQDLPSSNMSYLETKPNEEEE